MITYQTVGRILFCDAADLSRKTGKMAVFAASYNYLEFDKVPLVPLESSI